MSSDRTVAEAEETGFRGFYGAGRFVAVAAPLALATLTSAWLFLGAGTVLVGTVSVRDALGWAALGLLAVCLLVLGAAVVRGGGRSRRESYREAVRAGSTTPGYGEGAVPARLGGTGGQSARTVGVLVAAPALLALWAALGAADAGGSNTSAALARADAVIERLPISKIENQAVEGGNRRADATAHFTVLLPSPTGGDGVPATFRASTNRRESVGNDLYVAYVPDRPGLGAVGDDQRAEVERLLAGRAVPVGDAWLIAGLWALVTLGLVTGWWVTGGTPAAAPVPWAPAGRPCGSPSPARASMSTRRPPAVLRRPTDESSGRTSGG